MCRKFAAVIFVSFVLSFVSLEYFEDGAKYSLDLTHALNYKIVRPRILELNVRRRRHINTNVYYEEENKMKLVELGEWVFELDMKHNLLLAPQLESEWISENLTLHHHLEQCDYRRGIVQGLRTTSTVAMAVCGLEITGFVLVPGAAYFVQPFDRSNGSHIIYKSKMFNTPFRMKRSESVIDKFNEMSSKWEFFNLTGDTIDIDEDESEFKGENPKVKIAEELDDKINLSNNSVKWWREEVDSEELGYFFDTAWEANIKKNGKVTPTGMAPNHWLEIALAVDHTVISFHGRDRVEQYVLALMNIVSAIYQDSSLESNMQLVISRLLLFENKKQAIVKPGNAKKSLENVNAWNRRLHLSLAPGESRHDIAVWLTRFDIGGPSGYAPVGGVCDFKRSCALNRDEGLTSTFIIAHEMAHILGLSHDGDVKLGNNCGDDALEGSVMAPMVSATFHKFTWSECSRKELNAKLNGWACLQNHPSGKEEFVLNATIEAAFSMDEQCRMEFGEGFQLCRAFDIIEPCSHLWCGHVESPLVCKTKKGPPLEGTECGFDMWCINGYCETVDRKRFQVPPVLYNPQDGGWSEWSLWGSCSRSCGVGVQFRTRLCNNPTPSYGGNNCVGLAEEWRLCNIISCPDPIADVRAQQCRNIIGFLKLQDRRANMSWLPYESDHTEMKCQLICISKETRELFVTGENLTDGTPCSYENASDICIQGHCQKLGCDGIISSNLKEDICGICGGNNSDCSTINTSYQKRIKKAVVISQVHVKLTDKCTRDTLVDYLQLQLEKVSRIAVIPKHARNMELEANVTMAFVKNPAATFILKNRMKKKYSIPIPGSGIYAEIIEGTRFHYKKIKENHKLWAKGPLLVEMVVLLYAPKSEVNLGLNISVNWKYNVQKESFNTTSRFNWILGGWGPCSASCGGGRRQKTIACWDLQNNKIVRRKFCSLVLKPSLETELCNNYSCDFHWITGVWEPCSVTCGSYGTQSRELYCLPQSVLNTVSETSNSSKLEQLWRFMVNPLKCAGLRPISLRPCYRIPCPSYWEYGEWSQCSASCGSGVAARSTHCPPPEGETFYTCGTHPKIQRRVCKGPYTRRNNSLCNGRKKKRCYQDQSKYCALPTLSKYCKLKSFKRLCCKSCSTYTLFPFSA